LDPSSEYYYIGAGDDFPGDDFPAAGNEAFLLVEATVLLEFLQPIKVEQKLT